MLHDLIGDTARATPDAPAVVCGGRSWSYAEVDRRVRRLSAAIHATTAPGDRVAIVGENAIEWIDCYYGVPLAGRVLVPLNHRLAPAAQVGQLERVGASVLVADGPRADALTPLLHGRSPRLVRTDDGSYDDLVASGTGGEVAPATDAHAPAWILFTSGTTGAPKGAVLTAASLEAAVANVAAARPVLVDDVYLFPFPLCHVAGYNVLLFHRFGRPVVLLPRFDATAFVAAIDAYGVTVASLAPTMLATLMEHLEALGRGGPSPLAPLRSVGYGASGIPEALLRRVIDRLGVDLSQGYGMTELSGNVAFLGPEEHRLAAAGATHLLRAAGKPVPGVELRVVGDDLHDVPAGAPGEIVVRAPQVMAGYWRDGPATAATIVDGWLRTGDVGRLDDDGYLYVVDRRKDVIVTGGENVASREVEDIIHRVAGVREVAVVGVPDPHWGEAVCAVIAPFAGTTVDGDAVVDAVRTELAGFKKPRHVLFVDDLPKSASGKVLKQELRRLAADRLGRG